MFLKGGSRLCANIPQLHAQNFEFRAVVTEGLVAERGTGAGYPVLEVII